MHTYKSFFAMLLFFSCPLLFSQSYSTGRLNIHTDPRLDSLVQENLRMNKYNIMHHEHDGIEGYRIQIFFDSGNDSKNRAYNMRNIFLNRFPEIPAYITFKEPYYRLRVGDFRSKLDAEGFLKKIIDYYPNAWVIKDKIKFPAL